MRTDRTKESTMKAVTYSIPMDDDDEECQSKYSKTKRMMTKTQSKITTIGYNIPLDLIIEILLKLPAKSVLRFRFVSKSWCSIICSQKFIHDFMSLSLARPRLVLAFSDWSGDRVLFFSSSHQGCSFLTSSSTLLGKENILAMPKFKSSVHSIFNSVRGFLCCALKDGFVVCNPTTRQVIDLGERNSDYDYRMYLGYDPNSDQYKVLRLGSLKGIGSCIEQSVRTLGGGQQSSHSWRPIKTNMLYSLYSHCHEDGVCIVDGVVYYKCWNIQNPLRAVLKSFDFGSEQVHDIDTPHDLDLSGVLTNYLGKLAVYCSLGNRFILWVLDDAKKDWSNETYVFPSFTDSVLRSFRFKGITAAGEIIYVPSGFSDRNELLCYDVEKKIERRVIVEGQYNSDRISSSLLCSYVDNIIYL